jgi:hypothetical protein
MTGMMRARVCVGLALAALALPLSFTPAGAEDHPFTGWTVRISQWDGVGTVVRKAPDFSCAKSGCQEVLTLDIAGAPQKFLATLSFVQRGAYIGLQPLASEVGKVVQFEKGYVGPVFMAVRDGKRGIDTLRFIVTGTAAKEAGPDRPTLMQNDKSLTFHRKVDPDLTLRIEVLAPSS